MKIAVVVNKEKPNAGAYADFAAAWLVEHGAQVCLLFDERVERSALLGSAAVLCVGGDGTILRTAGTLAGEEIPILGVNAGHLGYLTQLSRKEELPEALEALLGGDYRTEPRAMLRALVERDGAIVAEGIALNEVALTRHSGVRMLRFQVWADGTALNDYAADGLIVSTPTGSTAYNLSAGGPIVSPGAGVITLMPICAHALYGRGIVMEDSRVLEIRVQSDNQLLAFDGDRSAALRKGDCVRIAKAPERTLLVKLRSESFLKTLKEKMRTV